MTQPNAETVNNLKFVLCGVSSRCHCISLYLEGAGVEGGVRGDRDGEDM